MVISLTHIHGEGSTALETPRLSDMPLDQEEMYYRGGRKGRVKEEEKSVGIKGGRDTCDEIAMQSIRRDG